MKLYFLYLVHLLMPVEFHPEAGLILLQYVFKPYLLDVFETSERYQRDGIPLVILAGKDYGSGSSRDWAAKGPHLLGIRAVIAESFQKMHKNHLVGMGILPLQHAKGESADSLQLSGKERFSISMPKNLSPFQVLTVQTSTGRSFRVTALLENEMDILFYRHGGILKYVAHNMLLTRC